MSDSIFLILLVVTWYTSVGEYENISLSYNLKTSLPLWAMILALQDPRTIITDSFIEALTGPGIIPAYYGFPLIGALVEGVLFWYVGDVFVKGREQSVELFTIPDP